MPLAPSLRTTSQRTGKLLTPCPFRDSLASFRDNRVIRAPQQLGITGRMTTLCRELFKRHIVINALRVALVVGVLLNIINHGGALTQSAPVAWNQVLLNFLVPYCVASYSAAKNELQRKNGP